MENQDAQRLYASSAETRGGIERLIFDGTIRTVVDIDTTELCDLSAFTHSVTLFWHAETTGGNTICGLRTL